uniref:R13L1/DRL21-like LRR repeat region domain-containing protein n=1 Tax=Quercus lobata TaxID=97700 RepID=A0A7N2KWN9_QUELO
MGFQILRCVYNMNVTLNRILAGFQIGESGKLPNLRGTILIAKLQYVINPTDALYAKLKAKRQLKDLTLEWDADDIISQSERDVLNNLQPHTNLKRLFINNYSGTSFPNWVGDYSFSNVKDVHLNSCRFCLNLPSLGQLPSLQNLGIVGFDEVVKVGPDFYGGSSSTITPFQSLKILNFERMIKWEEWFSYEGGAFPCLQELRLEDCPKLSRSLPKHLPSLTTSWIRKCSKLGTSLPRAPAIHDLRVTPYNDMLLQMNLMIDSGPLFKSLDLKSGGLLSTLSILNCRKLQFPMYPCYYSLESLYISYSCNTLNSFPLHIFPKLRVIRIETYSKMESLSVLEGHHLVDLISLKIEDCPNFVAFPSGGLPAPNLIPLLVNNCQRLSSMPTNMHRLLPSLQHLEIRNCPQLKSFPKGGLPSNLVLFRIDVWENLFATRMDWGLKRLHSFTTLILSNLASDFQAVESFPSDFQAVESFPEENLLPTSLTTLFIGGFQNLRSLDNKGLQHLTSLQQLRIVNCPELKHMPKVGLPVSIYYLRIYSCPFSKQCKEKKGKEWHKIAHFPFIHIDDDVVIRAKIDLKPLQTAQEAQHVTAPSVHFVLTTGKFFGFDTSVEEAQQDINAAHVESESIENGIGVVKLIGRYSGHGGLFEFIEKRLKEMVIVMQDKGFFLKAWAPTTSRMLLSLFFLFPLETPN